MKSELGLFDSTFAALEGHAGGRENCKIDCKNDSDAACITAVAVPVQVQNYPRNLVSQSDMRPCTLSAPFTCRGFGAAVALAVGWFHESQRSLQSHVEAQVQRRDAEVSGGRKYSKQVKVNILETRWN